MRVRSHKLRLVMSPTSNSRAGSYRRIKALFRGLESDIPGEILTVVETTLFAADRKYHFPIEDFVELAQGCLAKVWQKRDKFQTAEPAYFGRIVKNTVVDYFRKNSRNPIRCEGDFHDLAALEVKFQQEALECDHSKGELVELIEELDPLEADIVLFKFFEEKSYEQVSVLLSISVYEVKQRLRSALINLRHKLRREEFVIQPLRQVEKPGN